ncbi:MAG: sulfite reductase [Thermodesulfobacteriota bacterium]
MIKGYQLNTCFGPKGCPNRAVQGEGLAEKLLRLLDQADLHHFLKQRVPGPLKHHHEFRVSLAECPNACSRPQIKDIGLIGAVRPRITAAYCKQCGNCTALCPDRAVVMGPGDDRPRIDECACLSCGICIENCQTGTLTESARGWKILVGGKLGRRPRLAREIPGIYSADAVLGFVGACLEWYRKTSTAGERFAEILTPAELKNLVRFLGEPLP